MVFFIVLSPVGSGWRPAIPAPAELALNLAFAGGQNNGSPMTQARNESDPLSD
jgi:hypothetical protein